MLKTILVDDERPALKALEHLLKQYPEVEIAGAFTDIDQARECLGTDIDVVFLDIDMQKQNGIDAAKEILAGNSKTEIVFVTAYSHFAVEAFEVNALDYVMKPVSPKRLDKTMERIAQKHLAADHLAMQRERTSFLNGMLTEKVTDLNDIWLQAKKLGIDFTKACSLFVVLATDEQRRLLPEFSAEQQRCMDTLIGKLAAKAGLVPWQGQQGVGILDFTLPASAENRKQEELDKALWLKQAFAGRFPDYTVTVGISGTCRPAENFAECYMEARNAAGLGLYVSPEEGVYHFLDSSFLPVLDQYINQQNVDHLLQNTIGRILKYDRSNGTELFRTMEAIILRNSLQDVAQSLFVHYKTVQFRKQNIEKILGISLHSFAGRTMLGVALTLFYLKNLFPEDHPAG